MVKNMVIGNPIGLMVNYGIKETMLMVMNMVIGNTIGVMVNYRYKGYYDMGTKVDYNPDEPKVIELTLSDIANKLGIDLDKLRIKE